MLSSPKGRWPCFRFPPKGTGGTNGRTLSVYARNPGKMRVGEQERSVFPTTDASRSRTMFGEGSSVDASLGSGEEGKPKSWEIKELQGHEAQKSREEELAQRIEELQKELYDYQYHMGLLLIEKRMRTSEFEELRQGLTEAKENMRRECLAFSNILIEKQKLEQSIMLALDRERKHVADLEKTICKMQAEENYFFQQRPTQYCWEPGFQEHEKELKESHDFCDERRMNTTDYNDALCDEKKEHLEETSNCFDILDAKEKETGSKLENEEGVVVATEVKLAVGKNIRHSTDSEIKTFQPEKLVFEEELETKREPLDKELNHKVGNLGKQIVVGEEYRSKLIDDLLVQNKEIEADTMKVLKDKETLSALYSSLQNLKIEMLKKRGLLLSFAERCKTCKNCSTTIFSQLELGILESSMGAQLAGDGLLSSISHEHLEKRTIDQNSDGCMPSLQQCSVLLTSEGKDGSLSTGARCKEMTERLVESVQSAEQGIHCETNVSSINEESKSSDEPWRKKRPREGLCERISSVKSAAKEAEAILKVEVKEMEQHPDWKLADVKIACVENKLCSLGSDLMGPKLEEPSPHAHDRAISIMGSPSNEEKHKRQKTSDVGMSSNKKRHYNFRPSTILKASRSRQQKSEEVLVDGDSDGADADYEPEPVDSD